jgi:hypothetical protein
MEVEKWSALGEPYGCLKERSYQPTRNILHCARRSFPRLSALHYFTPHPIWRSLTWVNHEEDEGWAQKKGHTSYEGIHKMRARTRKARRQQQNVGTSRFRTATDWLTPPRDRPDAGFRSLRLIRSSSQLRWTAWFSFGVSQTSPQSQKYKFWLSLGTRTRRRLLSSNPLLTYFFPVYRTVCIGVESPPTLA